MYARMLHGNTELEPVVSQQSRKRFAEWARELTEYDIAKYEADADTHETMTPRMSISHSEWPELMILILRYRPDISAQILQTSYPHSKPPFYMVASTIDFVVRFVVNAPATNSVETQASPKPTPNEVVQVILDLISQCNHERSCIHNGTVNRLLEHLDLQHGYALFNGLQAFESHINPVSCIAFAEFFAYRGEYETALEALELYLDNGGSHDDFKLKATASKILRRSIINPQGYHDSGYIISRFMDMGLTIGLYFQNTLIANAFDSNDVPTALNVFSLMKEQRVEPDAFTYSAMLKGLRNSDDEELVDDVLGLSWAKFEETKSDYLACEVLYWYYAQHARRAAGTWDKDEKAKIHIDALQQLVSLYTRVYDSKPLDVLGFSNLVPTEAWSPPSSLALTPDPFIMSLMILAYTRAKVLVAEAADDEDDLPWQIGTNYRLYQR